MLIPPGQSRPRLWVRLILNRFFHHRGKNSVVRLNARMDLFPFNKFSLGAKSIVEDFAVINNGVGDVFIGEGSGVGISTVIIGPVKIGNFSMTAQHVVISGLNHGYQDVSMPPRHQKVTTQQITIDDNVWIGANCVVTAGVTIGKHSVIGAGSVVTRDIPPYSVAVGNPAKVIKQYNFTTQLWEKA